MRGQRARVLDGTGPGHAGRGEEGHVDLRGLDGVGGCMLFWSHLWGLCVGWWSSGEASDVERWVLG